MDAVWPEKTFETVPVAKLKDAPTEFPSLAINPNAVFPDDLAKIDIETAALEKDR
jgi:hypothetical protein